MDREALRSGEQCVKNYPRRTPLSTAHVLFYHDVESKVAVPGCALCNRKVMNISAVPYGILYMDTQQSFLNNERRVMRYLEDSQ